MHTHVIMQVQMRLGDAVTNCYHCLQSVKFIYDFSLIHKLIKKF
jgi:hypothetical protein